MSAPNQGDVVLKITMSANGSLNVEGPIDNAILAFGLLTAAQNAIHEHQKAQANRVVRAPAPLLNLPTP